MVGAGFCSEYGALREKRAKPGDAILPALTAGDAQGGQVFVTVMSVRQIVAGGRGAEKVKIDGVHDLRPGIGSCVEIATKHGIFRIRKIYRT